LASVQAEEIMNILTKLNKEGHTVVIVTHEPSIAARAKRTIGLKDGKVVEDRLNGYHKLMSNLKTQMSNLNRKS